MNHEEYLKSCLKTFKEDDTMSQMDHCRWSIIEEIGEISGVYKKHFGYKRPKDERWTTLFIEECGDLLYYLTVLSNLVEAEGIISHLDGIHTVKNEDSSELFIITQMLDEAKSIALSSPHNPYIDSSICNIVNYLRVLINREGIGLFQIMEANIAKLKQRHGDKFKESQIDHENRDKEAELNNISQL